MTSIKIERNPQGRCRCYTVLGHVENPVICAGVSAITQTTAVALQEVLNHKIRINSTDGFFKVTFVQIPTLHSELLIESMLAGLKKLEKQYQGVIYIIDIRKEGEVNETEKAQKTVVGG